MRLKFFNTLHHKLEDFHGTAPDKVKLYTCGPTVYNYAHIGNLRAYVSADIAKRTLNAAGYDVDWVMNITDLDDKTIANTVKEFGAKASVSDLREFTDRYFQAFLEDLAKINIDRKDIRFIKVSEKIADIQLYILELMRLGYAYKTDDGVFFSIEKYQNDFGDYGALVGEKFLEGRKIGARVKVDEYDKDNLCDFALWKAYVPEDAAIFWDHPALGKGRPGWHIECTLINYFSFEGQSTDIHTGGVDLIFPHHTNEIAQANPIYKRAASKDTSAQKSKAFVNYWLHSEHLAINNAKMSKSLGNFWTLADLEKKGITGLDLRFLFLQSHYRGKLNVTEASLLAAANGLERINRQVAGVVKAAGDSKYDYTDDKTGDYTRGRADVYAKFKEALANDLNTPEALANLSAILGDSPQGPAGQQGSDWELSAAKEQASADKTTSAQKQSAAEKLEIILAMDEILGLNLGNAKQQTAKLLEKNPSPELQALIAQREQARREKDFSRADLIRRQIEAMGYELVDSIKETAGKSSGAGKSNGAGENTAKTLLYKKKLSNEKRTPESNG